MIPFSDAAQITFEFLNQYVDEQNAFSLTGDLADFRIEFQEVREADDGSMIIVFRLPAKTDATKPTREVQILARQCHEALIVAHPELKDFRTSFEYVNE